MMCGLSKVDEGKLQDIQSMEKKLGKPILAFTCHDISPAELTNEELSRISEMEKKLGIYLVAVKE